MRFVLVHGGGHGAWCWNLLIPELQKLGHEAVAMDLPGSGQRRDEVATLTGWRDTVIEVLRPGDVLVGHSMGGVPITMAADAFPEVAHVCYIAGLLPIEGATVKVVMGDAMNTDEALIEFKQLEPIAESFYQDCSPEITVWAFERLTPVQTRIMHEPISVPTFWGADLPRSFIRCLDDRTVNPDWAHSWARRLGVEELTIPSSHSPFLSRPTELAALLVHALQTRPIGPLDPTAP